MRAFFSNLWQVVRPYRGRFTGGVLLGLLAGLKDPMLLASVYFVFIVVFPKEGGEELAAFLEKVATYAPGVADWLGRAVNEIIHQPSLVIILSLLAVLPLTMLVGALFNYGYVYYMQWVSVRAVGDLRTRLYAHLLHMPPGFLQRHSTGELMSRVSNDITSLHTLLASSLVTLIRDPVTLVVLIGSQVMLWPKLTLMSLLILPATVVPAAIFARRLRKSAREAQSRQAGVFQSMHEGLTGSRVVKAYNLEPVLLADFRERLRSYNGRYMRMIRAAEISSPMIEFVGSVGLVGLLTVLILWDERPAAVDFMTFVLAIQMIYMRIKHLIRLGNQFVQAQASSQRVFELLAMPSNLPEPAQPRPIPAAGQPIEFANVTFGYDGERLFEDFNLKVRPGQLVALVGASGSGKTTLTNLLLRFYDPLGGAVRIGGVDLREAHSRELRAQIAVVTQETILFNETIRRNIELGRPGASEAEIIAAAKHAHAHDFILATPHGYDTIIGERGGNLSGGQRQRLAIARAILKNAPILILDEATSALDTESERAVQTALEELMKGRTTLCIAHRLSTVQHADLIVVMNRGRIAEMGTHQELLARGGLYQKLHSLQFRD
jgi:subfamily B ATP-binding cassette protein MsbA